MNGTNHWVSWPTILWIFWCALNKQERVGSRVSGQRKKWTSYRTTSVATARYSFFIQLCHSVILPVLYTKAHWDHFLLFLSGLAFKASEIDVYAKMFVSVYLLIQETYALKETTWISLRSSNLACNVTLGHQCFTGTSCWTNEKIPYKNMYSIKTIKIVIISLLLTKQVFLSPLHWSNKFMTLNTEYCNQRHINVHTHLPIVFDCRDVIKICGQLWSQEQPYMKFWASFLRIYGFQQAKPIRKSMIQIGLACWNWKIYEKHAHKFHVKLFMCFCRKSCPHLSRWLNANLNGQFVIAIWRIQHWFCLQDHSIGDPTEIIFEMSKDERKDFYRTVAKGLQRPLFSVYRRVTRMYDQKNYVGKYSPEEMQKLKE